LTKTAGMTQKHFSLVLIALLILSGCHSGTEITQNDSRPELKFSSNGTFKIAQFTDIHWNPASENNHKTLENIRHVIETEKPDLIVYTGDIVTRGPSLNAWIEVTAPPRDAGIPWAVTLGNHDDEHEITRNDIFDLLITLPGFVGEKGPDISGVGNYLLEVAGANSDQTAAWIWCFDSHGYPSDKELLGSYDWIKFDQIDWYRRESAQQISKANGKILPALAYFHIPLPEYHLIAEAEQTLGLFEEKVCSPDVNSGLFNAFLETGDVMGMFVGHDHVNNYIGKHMGIALGYGQVSGADAYGRFPRGSRIVVLKEGERDFDTWIRTAEGTMLHYNFFSGAQ